MSVEGLPTEFPPLRTLTSSKGNLPIRDLTLVGRQLEKDSVIEALEESRLVTLTGPGGGSWWIDVAGGLVPSNGAVAAHVTAPALTFPDWGTQRSPWRDSDVTVTGDTALAARFLDAVNVI